MTQILTEYLVVLFVVAGMITATLLGLALGLCGVVVATQTAYRRAKVIRRQRRQLVRARRDQALAVSQRDDCRRQLDLATAALDEIAHPVAHSDDLPVVDSCTEELLRNTDTGRHRSPVAITPANTRKETDRG